MLALEFIAWWYGQGWVLQIQNARKRLVRTSHLFSLPILLRTLFSPWKKIITDPGAGMEEHVRAATDNIVSRLVGFSVRILVVISAILIVLFVGILSVIEIIVWPLLPPASIFSLIKGII